MIVSRARKKSRITNILVSNNLLHFKKNKIHFLAIPFVIISLSIVDMLNGYLLFLGKTSQLSTVLKIPILMIGAYLSVIYYKFIYSKLLLSSVFLFFISIFAWSFHQEVNTAYEIKVFSKYIYLYCSVLMFYFFIDNLVKTQSINNISDLVFKALSYLAILLALMISICYTLKLGYRTYGEYAFGVKGFYDEGNSLGQIFLLSYIACIRNTIRYKKFNWGLISIFVLISITAIGTITSAAGATLIIIAFTFYYMFFMKSNNMSSIYVKIIVLFIGLMISFYLLVNIYDYIFSNSYTLNKVYSLLENGTRAEISEYAKHLIIDRDFVETLVGEGQRAFGSNFINYFAFGKKATSNSLWVEIDYLDVLGIYGALGLILYLTTFLYALILALVNFVKVRSLDNYSLLLGVTIICGHSFLAGHVAFSPVTQIIFALYIATIFFHRRKNA